MKNGILQMRGGKKASSIEMSLPEKSRAGCQTFIVFRPPMANSPKNYKRLEGYILCSLLSQYRVRITEEGDLGPVQLNNRLLEIILNVEPLPGNSIEIYEFRLPWNKRVVLCFYPELTNNPPYKDAMLDMLLGDRRITSVPFWFIVGNIPVLYLFRSLKGDSDAPLRPGTIRIFYALAIANTFPSLPVHRPKNDLGTKLPAIDGAIHTPNTPDEYIQQMSNLLQTL